MKFTRQDMRDRQVSCCRPCERLPVECRLAPDLCAAGSRSHLQRMHAFRSTPISSKASPTGTWTMTSSRVRLRIPIGRHGRLRHSLAGEAAGAVSGWASHLIRISKATASILAASLIPDLAEAAAAAKFGRTSAQAVSHVTCL